MSTLLSLLFTIFLKLLNNMWASLGSECAGWLAFWNGEGAVGGEGHLLRGGARRPPARLARHHHYKVGVLCIACALRKDHPGVGEGATVVADLVRDPRPFWQGLGQAVLEVRVGHEI